MTLRALSVVHPDQLINLIIPQGRHLVSKATEKELRMFAGISWESQGCGGRRLSPPHPLFRSNELCTASELWPGPGSRDNSTHPQGRACRFWFARQRHFQRLKFVSRDAGQVRG